MAASRFPIDRSIREIEIFTGGAVVFDADLLTATGGFDERLFLYYEDVDLARRGRRLGWRYRVVPESTVEHRRSTSTGERPDETLFLQERNRISGWRFDSAPSPRWGARRGCRYADSDTSRSGCTGALAASQAWATRHGRLIERIRDGRAPKGSLVRGTGIEALVTEFPIAQSFRASVPGRARAELETSPHRPRAAGEASRLYSTGSSAEATSGPGRSPGSSASDSKSHRRSPSG